ncbi:MAG TPA: DUF1223 domain-containing protein [Caulobacteraceae bacterium]|nr:DUF1223 domain-containing protein [Caulobacteraceae bacterium]
MDRLGELVAMTPRLLAILASAAALAACHAQARPVVVELFQSQGCSSCPPANANLAKVADRPDVIALSYSVTYWDGLGWKDTFAQPKFTSRQWDYAHALRHTDVFTPQVVVDGRRDGVGADPADFARLVGAAGAAAPGPSITLAGNQVTIAAGPKPAAPADVWLARYDPRILNVPVRGGENGGRTLPHKDIVRELIRIGGWTGAAETLTLPAPTQPGLKTAILVQSAKTGPILAAVKD